MGLAHGQNHHIFGIFRSPLGIRIEVTHGIQLVTEEFGAYGPVRCGRVYVQNSATDGKLARAFHHAAAAIAGAG